MTEEAGMLDVAGMTETADMAEEADMLDAAVTTGEAELVLSSLGHTWILDLDGTIVKHNGYKIDGEDSFLPNAESFLDSLPEEDIIIFMTSRTENEKELTEKFLKSHQVRYHHILYNIPYGERILINDRKPSGLCTAIAISEERDNFEERKIRIDPNL